MRISPAVPIALWLALPVSPASGQTCPAEQGSPHGSVPFGLAACSPDKKHKAKEVEPQNNGRIGIFDAGDKRLRVIDVGESNNVLKAVAFSPNSKTLAVHYHHDRPAANYVALYEVATGKRKAYIPTDQQWNQMRFASDGGSLLVRSKENHSGVLPVPQQ